MSATGRSAVRVPADYYPTPAWCVHRLLERVTLPDGEWLEPAAGDGAIIRAVKDCLPSQIIGWTAVELRAECKPSLLAAGVDGVNCFAGGYDFLAGHLAGAEFDVSITNPPFSLAEEFVREVLAVSRYVAMLLRINFLGSAKRRALFATEIPDIYVLPNRPSFTGKGTDATEYAWFVWGPERGRTSGRIEILSETPATERRR